MNEATCTWSGQLPPRNYKNPVYSCKVFLGGVPWDITEGELPPGFLLQEHDAGLEAGLISELRALQEPGEGRLHLPPRPESSQMLFVGG